MLIHFTISTLNSKSFPGFQSLFHYDEEEFLYLKQAEISYLGQIQDKNMGLGAVNI